jgi:hypothetical protein
MVLSLLVFLQSFVITDSFTPFPSGYSSITANGVVTVAVENNEGFFSVGPDAPFLPLAAKVFILPGRCGISSVSVSLEEPVSTRRLPAPLAGAPMVLPVGSSPRHTLTATTRSISLADAPVSVHTGHILDAFTVVTCSVNPWIYLAGSNELGLSSLCSVTLEYTEAVSRHTFSTLQAELISFRIAALAEKHSVLFSNALLESGVDAEPDYLIITGSDYLDEIVILENLLETKQLSFRTLAVEDIYGNWGGTDVQEDIRNCIKHYAFNNGTAFVVLAGDETIVPVREVYTECEGFSEFAPSDLYYADLDGTWDSNGNGIYGEYADNLDLYPDILLGRLLFSSPEGATAVFEKNTIYAGVNQSETWYKNVVLCGAILFPGIGYTGVKGCELMAKNFPDSFNLTKAYELSIGDHPDTYQPVLFSGAGWNHYAGHGNDRGVYWIDNTGILTVFRMAGFCDKSANTEVVSNPGRTGIHSSIGCHTGDFTDPGVCLPDTLLTLANGGGVAGFFNTSWGWEGYWPEIGSTERLCNNTVHQVFVKKAPTLGVAYASAIDMEIPNMTGPYDRVMQSIISYSAFMDPSLKVLGVTSFEPPPPPPFQLVMLSSNPITSGEELRFKVTGISHAYDISVFNLAGRAVYESVRLTQNTQLTMKTNMLSAGVYFVSAMAPGGKTVSGSFVVLPF